MAMTLSLWIKYGQKGKQYLSMKYKLIPFWMTLLQNIMVLDVAMADARKYISIVIINLGKLM